MFCCLGVGPELEPRGNCFESLQCLTFSEERPVHDDNVVRTWSDGMKNLQRLSS